MSWEKPLPLQRGWWPLILYLLHKTMFVNLYIYTCAYVHLQELFLLSYLFVNFNPIFSPCHLQSNSWSFLNLQEHLQMKQWRKKHRKKNLVNPEAHNSIHSGYLCNSSLCNQSFKAVQIQKIMMKACVFQACFCVFLGWVEMGGGILQLFWPKSNGGIIQKPQKNWAFRVLSHFSMN